MAILFVMVIVEMMMLQQDHEMISMEMSPYCEDCNDDPNNDGASVYPGSAFLESETVV